MSDAVVERLAKVEEKINNSNQRIAKQEDEITSLRESRHIHNGMISNHTGILVGLESALKSLSEQMRSNTHILSSFRGMAITAIVMGGTFISFCVFVGGNLLKWW